VSIIDKAVKRGAFTEHRRAQEVPGGAGPRRRGAE